MTEEDDTIPNSWKGGAGYNKILTIIIMCMFILIVYYGTTVAYKRGFYAGCESGELDTLMVDGKLKCGVYDSRLAYYSAKEIELPVDDAIRWEDINWS